jgi:adenosyl cobinamide kinase/adenosyl cobinamide phosphate guanylyltransferase
MGIPVLILGESGSGKSTSLINLDAKDCILIQSIDKRLPFRKPECKGWVRRNEENPNGNVFVTDNYKQIISIVHAAANSGKKQIIIIDDVQYLMANDFMRRAMERGFDKFTEMAVSFHSLFQAAQQCKGDVRVYFLAHTDIDATGKIKMKTIGKMLDEKITMEGLFTVVLKSHKDGTDNQFKFQTAGTAMDTVKSPAEMFETESIPNDLELVDSAIKNYWL